MNLCKLSEIESIINQLKKFQDIDQCQHFIQTTSAKDRLVLIVSDFLEGSFSILVPLLYLLVVYVSFQKGNAFSY